VTVVNRVERPAKDADQFSHERHWSDVIESANERKIRD
jgi:hypothetical protein